jgi:hypothetical protein
VMRLSWENVIDPFWIDPANITWKIAPVNDLHGSKDGDWDIERKLRFDDCVKARAIRERFVENKEWAETELFTVAYKRRLQKEGRVGRCLSLTALAAEYERRYGGLFKRLSKDGFTTDNGKGKIHALPSFLIGRDGEVFIGNQGNHRLAMAKVLGLKRIAGRIVCRHELWTG